MPLTRGRRASHPKAFTLVELLVVIGIIAVLISILLPTLASARRVAQAAKCGAALREIGNAYQLYAMENKFYYPPMRCVSNYKLSFGNVDYDGAQTYWMYFLGKYISKAKFGAITGLTSQEAARQMGSVLWGCPNFQPVTLSGGTTSLVYTGYGMNGFPEYTRTYPPTNSGDPLNALGDSASPTTDQKAVSSVNCTPAQNWRNITAGRWYKQNEYTAPAERALVGDCRAYVLEAMGCPNVQSIAPQADITSLPTYFWANSSPVIGETSYDYYRHGKYPKKKTFNTFDTTGGKVGFNVLFADGHVETLITRDAGIKAARMRFPG